MQKVRCVCWAALVAVIWLGTSCATFAPGAAEFHARFQEGAKADLVLRFYTWDSIHITKPDTREDRYLPLYARDDIGRVVKRRDIGRGMAVVVVSRFYRDPPQLKQLSRAWNSYLGEYGFQRVVMLHAGPGKEIDGLPIVNDTDLSVPKLAHSSANN